MSLRPPRQRPPGKQPPVGFCLASSINQMHSKLAVGMPSLMPGSDMLALLPHKCRCMSHKLWFASKYACPALPLLWAVCLDVGMSLSLAQNDNGACLVRRSLVASCLYCTCNMVSKSVTASTWAPCSHRFRTRLGAYSRCDLTKLLLNTLLLTRPATLAVKLMR